MQSTDSSYKIPPFPAFPSTGRYVPLGSVSDALGRVCRSIDARDAISLVVGPPGTGKSLICGLLVDHYRDSHEVVVLGETPIENQAAFLRHLLHHLGADFDSIPDGDLQLALVKHVCGEQAPEGGLLIVVDEAQSLSPEVIESIRMVTNITREGEPRVLAVLCGGVKLDEILVEPSMEAFTQRVATRCYLHAMNAEETRRYVTETIRNCGADPDGTITDEAIAAVHHACSGVPRLVNQMLTQAIDCAEEADQALITEQIMDQAWAQLQQLPSPMVEEPKIAGNGAPIEFGELDDSIDFGQRSQGDGSPLLETSPLVETSPVAEDNSGTCEPGECKTGQCEPGQCEPDHGETNHGETNHGQSADSSQCGDAQTDIEVEDSTAQWINEPAPESNLGTEPAVNPPLQPALSESAPESLVRPEDLFGDFDEEEELTLGNGVAPRAQEAPATPPASLESMLHQEIVTINSFATSDPTFNQTGDECETCEELEQEPEEQVEDFITVTDDELDSNRQDDPDPALWLPDQPDQAGGIRLADDSDILIIEDELDLEHVEKVARVDSQDQTISVDFQAMLNRMRSST